MTKDELIARQQIEIEIYKDSIAENRELKSILIGCFYGIGQPLNDNILKFNKEQMKWCFKIAQYVEDLNVS